MIEIRPSDLAFAARLGPLRRRPNRSTGSFSVLRFHLLRYAGGDHLEFVTTDSRVMMISRLPVVGHDEPWACLTSVRGFEALARHVEGGRLTLIPELPHRVRAVKGVVNQFNVQQTFLFSYPLFNFPRPWPDDERSEDATIAGRPIPRVELRKALDFVAWTQGEVDPGSRTNVCSLTQEGNVVAYHDHVFFRAKTSRLPLDVDLLRADAGRLLGWLRLLRERDVKTIDINEMSDARGGRFVQFATPDRLHRFQVMRVPKKVPLEFVDQVNGEAPAVCCLVMRDALLEVASYFQHFRGHLRWKFQTSGDQPTVLLTSNTGDGDGDGGGGSILLQKIVTNAPIPTEVEFLVSPKCLRLALARHRTAQIQVAYRPGARRITISDVSPVDRIDGLSGNESIVRVAAT